MVTRAQTTTSHVNDPHFRTHHQFFPSTSTIFVQLFITLVHSFNYTGCCRSLNSPQSFSAFLHCQAHCCHCATFDSLCASISLVHSSCAGRPCCLLSGFCVSSGIIFLLKHSLDQALKVLENQSQTQQNRKDLTLLDGPQFQDNPISRQRHTLSKKKVDNLLSHQKQRYSFAGSRIFCH